MSDQNRHDLSPEEQEEERAIKAITERFFPGSDHNPFSTGPEEVQLLGEAAPPGRVREHG